MKRSLRRAIIIMLSGAAGCVVILAILSVWFAMAAPAAGAQTGFVQFLVGGVTLAAVFGVWYIFKLVDRHFHELDRLRGAIVTLAGNQSAVLPLREPGEIDLEIERLHQALGDLTARYAEERAVPDSRLGAVLASISEALVVITEQGQVSLVNYLAKDLLGGERVRVGTSVFAALERDPVTEAVERARRAGQAVEAGRRRRAGPVLTFAHAEGEHRPEVEHDLELHDQPPAPRPLTDDTHLTELPATVMDTETTGLNPAKDRVISIGGVRVYGGRVYRRFGFDRLVRPGVPIPGRSTAIHGINDAMVADADSFASVYHEFAQLSRDTVLIGHNIAFDVAMLRRECAMAKLPWREPKVLDTLLLADALKLGLPGLSLEILADYFSVNIRGRHTALGDSLVTAEIYVRMLPLVLEAGVSTLGEAVTFSNRARHLIAQQKAAGWHPTPGAEA